MLETVQELVLQPQSEIWRVRRFLCENGWRIVCEDIVLDEGKYYPMFRAVKGQAEPYGPGELLYGKSACQRSPEVMLEFLGKRLQNARQIQERLGSQAVEPEDPRIRRRREELAEEIRLLEQMLSEYVSGEGPEQGSGS